MPPCYPLANQSIPHHTTDLACFLPSSLPPSFPPSLPHAFFPFCTHGWGWWFAVGCGGVQSRDLSAELVRTAYGRNSPVQGPFPSLPPVKKRIELDVRPCALLYRVSYRESYYNTCSSQNQVSFVKLTAGRHCVVWVHRGFLLLLLWPPVLVITVYTVNPFTTCCKQKIHGIFPVPRPLKGGCGS